MSIHVETSLSSQNQEPTYSTPWGEITFEQFHEHTRRLTANKLKQHGILDRNDLEDCLQSAYLKIWQDMEVNRRIFADKPLNYIIQSLFFASKVQRFSHKRHFNKVSFTDIDRLETPSVSIAQLETWMDIQSVLTRVTEDIIADQYALFALYSLITQVKVNEVQQIAGCSSRTLSKRRNQVREKLAEALSDYHHYHSEQPKSTQVVSPLVAIALFDFT